VTPAGPRLGADDLRRTFDLSFAAPATVHQTGLTVLLLVRLGERRLAVLLEDVASLLPGRRIVPLPAAPRELLGLAGYRGRLVPVFSLRGLLGMEEGPLPGALLLARHQELIAFGVDGFEASFRLKPGDLPSGSSLVSGPLRGAVDAGSGPVPLLDLHSVVLEIHRRKCPGSPPAGG
jgi:purine-binding chemotaxis protein CheW